MATRTIPTEVDSTAELTVRQRRAALLLASGRRAKAVAAELQVTEDSVSRWRKLPAFQAAIATAEAELLGDYARQLTGLTMGATAAYAAGLSKDAPLLHRLRAADSVSRNLVSIRELATLEARIVQLEAAVEQTLAQAEAFANAAVERGEARRVDYRTGLRTHPDVSND